MSRKKGNNGPRVIESPVAFTQEEIDFYAISSAILDTAKIMWVDASKLADGKEKELQTEFMAYYAKLKQAFDAVKEGESIVRIGKDSLGNDWCFDENLFATDESMAKFLMSYFLIWMTKKSMGMVHEEAMEKAKQRIGTLVKKIRNLEEAQKALERERDEAEKKAQTYAGAWKLAKSSGRLQSKRARRVSANKQRRG